MKLPWLQFDSAWQPFTFKGVAAFAGAPLRRLVLMQGIFALLIALSVVWFFDHAWFPVVRQAILQMPEEGSIVSGKLNWTNAPPRSLAEGSFLAVVADLDHTGQIRLPADIQVELGRNDVRFISLLGYTDRPYSSVSGSLQMDFNRLKLEPWWGAWRLPILGMVFGGMLLGLVAVWWILASVYFVPGWLIGFFSNRRLSLVGSWQLAGAALMPGAFLMAMGIVAYGLGFLDLVQMAAVYAAHWVIGLVYCGASVFRLKKISPPLGSPGNPFQPEGGPNSKQDGSPDAENPFKTQGK